MINDMDGLELTSLAQDNEDDSAENSGPSECDSYAIDEDAKINTQDHISANNDGSDLLQNISRSDLNKAIENGNISRLKEIFPFMPEEINKADKQSECLVHLAAKEGNRSVMEFLLDKGERLNVKDGNGLTPLHLAVR